ncbi:MAG: iron-containing redox enzyme family protein [Polyangiales bacterium]
MSPRPSLDETLAACREVSERHRASRHPFVSTLDEARPDRARLAAWAGEKYQQVFLQNVMFSAIHANAWDCEPVRQFMVEQLVAEETALTCGSASHYDLMRRFAEACGAPGSAFARGNTSAPVRRWVSTALAVCRERHPVVALLALHAIESQAGEAVARVLAWLRAHHAFTAHELEWFTVHSEAEDEHADAGLALVRAYAHEVPELHDQALDAVRALCVAWSELHDHYVDLLRGARAEAA